MYKILLADPLEPEGVALLRSKCEVTERFHTTVQELRGMISEYDGVLARANTRLDAETLRQASRLKVIGMPGVGTDHIDLEYARAHSIEICTVPGGNADAVAELTICHVLNLLRNVWASCRHVKETQGWNKYLFMGRNASGRRLGVIGLGRIGQRVAQLGKAFQMEVCAYDPFVSGDQVPDWITLKNLEELFAWGEVFTIHVPLTQETYHMISDEAISRMQPGAYLVNMSRGGLLDEEAVYRALTTGKLAGVGSDVMEEEPAPDAPVASSKLFALDNFLITPHLGAWTSDTQKHVARLVAQKMLTVLGLRPSEE